MVETPDKVFRNLLIKTIMTSKKKASIYEVRGENLYMDKKVSYIEEKVKDNMGNSGKKFKV